MSAPTVFGPDKLKAAIEADLALRGITGVEVLIGEWQTERHYGTTRVVVGRGRGQYEDPADSRYAANGWIDLGNGQVARALFGRTQTFPVWVHGYADDTTPPDQFAEAARVATDALSDQVAAAMRRAGGGLPLLPWPIEPLADDRGEHVYGSVVRIDAKVAIPVFDDPSDVGQADEAELDAQADVDGELEPASPETSVEP